MALKDTYDLQNLVNEAEELVLEEMEAQLEEEDTKDVCRCEECFLDMAALALNSLKPRYRVSLMGSLYASALHDNEQAKREVSRAVAQAIKKIHANPSHSR
jgi:competence protein ComFB